MPTDAKRKLDAMDWILGSAKVAQERSEYPVIADYPEIVQDTLRFFVKTFAFSSSSIPSKRSRTYGEWIKELTQLNTVCPTSALMERAVKISFDNYMKLENKFTIARPIAIKKLLVNAMREINLEERRKKEAEKQALLQKTISEDSAKQIAKNLKSLFKE
jgi:hypothetical protein